MSVLQWLQSKVTHGEKGSRRRACPRQLSLCQSETAGSHWTAAQGEHPMRHVQIWSLRLGERPTDSETRTEGRTSPNRREKTREWQTQRGREAPGRVYEAPASVVVTCLNANSLLFVAWRRPECGSECLVMDRNNANKGQTNLCTTADLTAYYTGHFVSTRVQKTTHICCTGLLSVYSHSQSLFFVALNQTPAHLQTEPIPTGLPVLYMTEDWEPWIITPRPHIV